MSNKAMWKNRDPRSCSGRNHVCGLTTGSGIPTGMCTYGTFRVLKNRETDRTYHLMPPEYGNVMPIEDAHQLDQETGRATPYGRNVVEFVQSRAARRRGFVSTDRIYNRRAAEGKRK